MSDNQKHTHDVYEDPEIVEGYIKANAHSNNLLELLEIFYKSLPGNRVIDIGCGPGHNAYNFADLGAAVTAVDYSQAMIDAAKKLRQQNAMPHFEVLNMLKLTGRFVPDSFDGAWISASLLHIPQELAPKVLRDVHTILVNKGRAYIGVKGGEQGSQMVTEDKYGKDMTREFTFWEKDKLLGVIEASGFSIISVDEKISTDGTTGGKPTSWITVIVEVNK